MPRLSPIVLLLICLLSGGCNSPRPQQNELAQQNDPVPRETWDALFLAGTQVGHVHTVTEATERQGEFPRINRTEIRTEAQSSMRLMRFGAETVVHLTTSCVETSGGEIVALQYQMEAPGSARQFEGNVFEGTLQYRVTSAGRNIAREMPWPRDTGGFFAVEKSLRRKPMTPGETRDLQAFEPMVDQIVTWQLVAEDWGDVSLLGGPARLLRIQATQTQPGGLATIDQTLWADRNGEVLKSHTSALDMELIRTTREIALRKDRAPQFDLGLDVVARLAQPLPGGHRTTYAEYELTLDGGDPAKTFQHGLSQQVRSVGANTARLIVRAVRPDKPPTLDKTDAPGEPPTEADRRASSLIQSDDPRIVEMSRSVATDTKRPWPIAVALEDYVHHVVTNKNFSQVFASAAEVASSREGDCTEHAVLLAALCRARGIPTRVAIGLVYSKPAGGFLYHMWNEAWIHDRWVPLDATLGLGGIGAAHLKVTDSNLSEANAYSSLLPILNVVGRLKVKVIDIH